MAEGSSIGPKEHIASHKLCVLKKDNLVYIRENLTENLYRALRRSFLTEIDKKEEIENRERKIEGDDLSRCTSE